MIVRLDIFLALLLLFCACMNKNIDAIEYLSNNEGNWRGRERGSFEKREMVKSFWVYNMFNRG